MRDRSFKLRGRLWTLMFTPLGGPWGLCDHQRRRLTVERDASDQMKLDSIIHECAHAYFPYLVESEIEGFGTTVADLLWKIGFRYQRESEK